MKTYTIWFLVGGNLATWETLAKTPQEAGEKFGGTVIAITAPGYTVTKDV